MLSAVLDLIGGLGAAEHETLIGCYAFLVKSLDEVAKLHTFVRGETPILTYITRPSVETKRGIIALHVNEYILTVLITKCH